MRPPMQAFCVSICVFTGICGQSLRQHTSSLETGNLLLWTRYAATTVIQKCQSKPRCSRIRIALTISTNEDTKRKATELESSHLDTTPSPTLTKYSTTDHDSFISSSKSSHETQVRQQVSRRIFPPKPIPLARWRQGMPRRSPPRTPSLYRLAKPVASTKPY
jgi:hypothetical protein